MLYATNPDATDLTCIWVRVYTAPNEYQRADYLRDHVLTLNATLLRETHRWREQDRIGDIRSFGRNFGTFYGLPWVRT